MEKTRKYDISFFGEFEDQALEREFRDYDMRRYAKVIGPVVLIFGVIYMMFVIADYFVIADPFSFMIILIVRALFLVVSVVVCLSVKKINNYTYLVYMITAYEILAIVGFLLIMDQYKSLTLLSFFSVMVITLAVYITPNKLTCVQLISTFLSLSFFIFHAKHIEGMETSVFLKLVLYNLIIIIYCNIGAYMTGFYKRKQFVDSRELLRVSITDPLTGIYNRGKFNEELNRWIDYCNRYENALSFVMLDIDDFKRVNDGYGHLIGDRVIQNIVLTIKKGIRNTDIFARWGGEEFVILLPNTDTDQAMEMMERMRVCIQNTKHDKVENITCSFGLVALRKSENAESLLQRADKLLYDAKNCGKNAVICEAGGVGERITPTHMA
ncbi:diguanylate cyclase [Alkaliphilus metalliredigens QYMF]|uniref:Diguanylate cyclase n=1 Tax=Alkaliphilus metalliredigens (strain QYMF) TaxID=293826 RepID=A6TNI4_ALKMQ|nr:GGDEF domain-containing protein [Alkaliphilus metalliredigens]ABR47752.1 diguanylate cyclase [Alkaliphilus metalliredigens QYMF]